MTAVFWVLAPLAGLFYYLRWLAPVFGPRPADAGVTADALEPAGRWDAAAAYTAGVASLAIGIAGAPVLPLLTGHLTR